MVEYKKRRRPFLSDGVQRALPVVDSGAESAFSRRFRPIFSGSREASSQTIPSPTLKTRPLLGTLLEHGGILARPRTLGTRLLDEVKTALRKIRRAFFREARSSCSEDSLLSVPALVLGACCGSVLPQYLTESFPKRPDTSSEGPDLEGNRRLRIHRKGGLEASGRFSSGPTSCSSLISIAGPPSKYWLRTFSKRSSA